MNIGNTGNQRSQLGGVATTVPVVDAAKVVAHICLVWQHELLVDCGRDRGNANFIIAQVDGPETILSTLKENFTIHPVLLIPPLLVIVMVVKKIPPLPALLGGTLIGGIFGMLLQSRSLSDVVEAAQTGFVSDTGVLMVDDLLSRGGLMSMMETVALIICALSFGGIMERTGMLEVLARALLKRVRRTGSLVTTTVLSCIGMNAIASDQYIAIVIPGRMYKNAFDAHKLHLLDCVRELCL